MKLFQVAKIVKVFRIDEAKVVIYLKWEEITTGAGRLMCKASLAIPRQAGQRGKERLTAGRLMCKAALQYPDRGDNGADTAGGEWLGWLKNKTGRLLNVQPARYPIDG